MCSVVLLFEIFRRNFAQTHILFFLSEDYNLFLKKHLEKIRFLNLK
jgi:hypothetical protein